MNEIEIINNYGDVDDLNTLYDFIIYCANKMNLKNVLFNVIIIDNDEIHKINKEYRGIDRPTDVISFALEDNEDIKLPGPRMLGDIYISYDKVISQANDYGHSKKRELCFLAVHGLLHLLGYDHMNKEDEEVMFNLQKEMLEEYGIKKG